jgi:drug/metabolite transporter (DMT)-like permease
MTPARSYQLGLLCIILCVIAWSTAGLFTRILPYNAPTILFWRGLFGALGTVALIILLPGTGGMGRFRNLGKPGAAYAAITALSMLLFISALLTTTVAHVAIITAIVPFVAAFLGWLIQRQIPGLPAIIASLAALAGVMIMVGLGTEGTLAGDILALLMATCMGGMILIARMNPTIPALAATAIASALSALATLPFATLGAVTPADLAILAAFALVNQVLGFGLFAIGSRLLPPMETALMTTLDAPLAPFWVWLIFAETPSAATMLGSAIVLTAVLAHLWHAARRAPA